MSPVVEKMITYDKLFDGSLTLFDILAMNEAISYTNDLQKKYLDIMKEVNNG